VRTTATVRSATSAALASAGSRPMALAAAKAQSPASSGCAAAGSARTRRWKTTAMAANAASLRHDATSAEAVESATIAAMASAGCRPMNLPAVHRSWPVSGDRLRRAVHWYLLCAPGLRWRGVHPARISRLLRGSTRSELARLSRDLLQRRAGGMCSETQGRLLPGRRGLLPRRRI
jgi:hypothetical protein